jgi:hypothetical protein
MTRTACLAVLLATLPTVAHAEAPPSADGDSIDVSAYKEKMKVLSDGKGHFVTLMPFTIGDGPDTGYLFYGDGKTFHAQRRYSGGRSGDESFDNTFWDPRVASGYQASFGFHDKKWTVQCGERITELKPLDKAEGQKLLDAAKFTSTRWKRKAYALARDNGGIYYYVDRAREPDDSKDFRVFRGPKGAVKPMKMVNVVNDSEGDIFITKAGKLRLVLDKHESTWAEGAKSVKLTPLDVGDNHILIYSELGVYTGEKLGTPCDDL